MRTLSTLCLCLVLGLVSSGQEETGRTSDEAAIREVVRRYVAARERNDPATIAALFTTDADQLTSSGEWRKGRDAIVRGTLASSKQTGGTRSITVESVRFPSADTAIADGRYEITGGAGGDRRMWTSFVLIRGKGEWSIAAIRNMLPAATAQ
jgi:uncharacterized protein (TIGR02246 family)